MRGIVDYFIKTPLAGNILMFFILILGITSAYRMKSSFFPEVPSRIITIQAIYPGASPSEIEEGVVTKIEENLVGVTGVERTTSVSSENSALVTVEVLREYDADLVLLDVKNAIDRIPSFPVGMEPLIVAKFESITRAINFSLSGDVDLKTLKRYARNIEDELLTKDGISKVTVEGFPDEEIEISFRESDLRSMQMTFDEAVLAIANANLEATGGIVKSEKEELIIRADSKQYFAQDFENIVLRSNASGGVIRLHQVADVRDSWQDSPTRSFLDKKPSVILTVNTTYEEDLIGAAQLVTEYVEEFNKSNEEIQAIIIEDQSKVIKARLDTLKENGALGFLIVMILLAMFLHWRLAFWVAIAIPISFAGMFFCGEYLGISYNVISSFAMILVIGILVDDGIVIAESIYQKYEDGLKPMEAALEGTLEVLPAVFAAIITTCVAFGMFFFLDGGIGDFFSTMAIVVIFSLAFSLIEGAFILPAHVAHSKALQDGYEHKNIVAKGFDKLMNFLRSKIYGPLLKWSMNYSFPTLAICITGLFLFVGAVQGGFIRTTFFPVIPRDSVDVTLEMKAGVPITQTSQILDKIEKAALEINEEFKEEYFNGEEDIIKFILRTEGPNTNTASLSLFLLEGEYRKNINNRIIISAIRDRVGPIYEAEKLTFGSSSPFGEPVSISLLSKDGQELDLAANRLKDKLEAITDLADIGDSNQEGNKEISLVLKPKAHNLGFTLGSIIRYVRQGFFGAEVQRLQRGEDEVKVWVRYKLDDRNELSDLSQMRVRSANGQSVPLSELVEFKEERGIVNINHISGQREIRVFADVSNDRVSISDVNRDIKEVILPQILDEYPSVSVGFEGQERENQKTQKSMQAILPIALLIMFFIIVLTFKSISQTLIVFGLMPFAFIGVGLGHFIMDKPISLFSVLGAIALIGVFVNDALVFITTFNQKIKSGMAYKDALYETGLSRFRPITLTSITTVAGLGPLLLEKSLQAQFLIPMAISVAFGLMVGTFILLVLTPALLVITNRIKRYGLAIWEGEQIDELMVEPAAATRVANMPLYLIAALIALIAFAAYVVFTFRLSELIV
jgi:multidrug efflux pump subunit AcrB